MDNIYIIIVGILFLLAIADLIVGVSNDAVNFLVSAIGSKAGTFKIIMIMASLGVLIGAIFSDGMMEVARKGIFHPDKFGFEDIIIIFLAVMLTDIILLDFFNTFGFPTSTTVSLVFELLGAAVAISIMLVVKNGGNVAEYINSNKALAIIGGILFSVIVAFISGVFIQWIARIIFSFNYEKSYKYIGAIWGGIAFTSITLFMFINGFKHSVLSENPIIRWILEHKFYVIIISFVFWSLIFQLLIAFTKINILKIVVLLGTFALAMAFAGNDLVNFIGVPLAGFSSFEFFKAGEDMSALSGSVKVNPYFLIIAGIVMVITLWTSKKARSVTDTSVNLSRQNAGYERFGSSQVSRALVRWAIQTGELVNKIVPEKLSKRINNRFQFKIYQPNEEAPAFDLIRASVILVVSSILIALATSHKLPLSTTYVTFMVTMGASLSDRAWGRESAVYRVTGVISVISGWFFTAFVAFTVAFVIAIIIYFGGTFAIGIMVSLDIFLIYRSRLIHKKRLAQEAEEIKKYNEEQELTEKNIFDVSTLKVLEQIKNTDIFIENSFKYFKEQDRKELKKQTKLANDVKKSTKELKQNIFNTVQTLKSNYLQSAQYYVQVVDAMRDVANSISYLGERIYEHINNNHQIFCESQMNEIEKIQVNLSIYIKECIYVIESKKFNAIEYLRDLRNKVIVEIESAKKQQFEIIQKDETDALNNDLFFNILTEYKNVALYVVRAVKAERKFYLSARQTIMKEIKEKG